jgi:hypothetical protein
VPPDNRRRPHDHDDIAPVEYSCKKRQAAPQYKIDTPGLDAPLHILGELFSEDHVFGTDRSGRA